MKLVVIESPYSGTGNTEEAVAYLRECLRDSLARGEAPFASHAIYTQPGVLRDNYPNERMTGIMAGLAWAEKAAARIVYTDLGITDGMKTGIEHAHRIGQPIVFRSIRKGDTHNA